jgi:hypothetical protein
VNKSRGFLPWTVALFAVVRVTLPDVTDMLSRAPRASSVMENVLLQFVPHVLSSDPLTIWIKRNLVV